MFFLGMVLVVRNLYICQALGFIPDWEALSSFYCFPCLKGGSK